MSDHGSPDTVEVGRDPQGRPRWAAAAVVLALVVGAYVAVRHTSGGHEAAAAKPPSTPSVEPSVDPGPPRPVVERPPKIVPWRDLRPGRPVFRRDRNGLLVTPYDNVTATGTIAGVVHRGDTLVFDVVLEAPGIVSLHPCPDYTITFGTHDVTRRLNCSQVPYFASLVRPDGKVSAFRPVLPAGTPVAFRMAVIVPDSHGSQQVRWSLDGPHQMPSFSGSVNVS